MMKQKDLILEHDWHYLLILDACRYDYFEKVYKDYFRGTLQKVISDGSDTPEWVKRNFGKSCLNDVVYVSANPYINSRVEIIHGFLASAHFHRIIDVWDWGWDEKVNTVRPETVCQAARRTRAKFPDKFLICHFMQPHFPYLTLPLKTLEGIPPLGLARGEEKKQTTLHDLTEKRIVEVLDLLGSKFVRTLRIRTILDTLKGSAWSSLYQEIAEGVGTDTFRNAYEANLRTVLKEIGKMVEIFPGKVVVTADHGELLGERGKYGHIYWSANPILIEVPWLEVEK